MTDTATLTFPGDELPPADHNAPPERLITGADLESYLLATYADNLARADEIMAKGKRFLTISSDKDDEDATEFMNAVRACWKKAEAARQSEKAPYDIAGGMAHAFFKSRILDPLGLAPSDKGMWDPLERPDLGMGPRITMAQTIWKSAKAKRERDAREAEAARLRKIEEEAYQKRVAAERAAREEEDRRRREAHAAEMKALEEARQADLAASRKRNEESRAKAEAESLRLRKLQEEARAAREAEEKRVAEEREIRDRANREEENRLAERRADAEAAASVSTADLSRARGGRGGVSSLKEWNEFRDTQRDILDYAKLGPYFTDKAVEQAIRAWADANKETVNTGIKTGIQPLKGATFYRAVKSASRA